jgi:hypothetical protein
MYSLRQWFITPTVGEVSDCAGCYSVRILTIQAPLFVSPGVHMQDHLAVLRVRCGVRCMMWGRRGIADPQPRDFLFGQREPHSSCTQMQGASEHCIMPCVVLPVAIEATE